MLNPYEAQEVYIPFIMRESSVYWKMIKCLKNRIAPFHKVEINDANRSDQPIVFIEVPIPPQRCNNYKSIIDYILFNGIGYTYRYLSEFSVFFSEMNWYFELTPASLDSFNFFISLPYVVFSFEKVIEDQPTAKANSSTAETQLGEHFKPVFSGSHERNDMEQLMNQYYNNYRRNYSGANPNKFVAQSLAMLKLLYSNGYKEEAIITEGDAQEYFKSILEPMCQFISNTSNEIMDIKYGNGLDLPVNPKQFMVNYPDLVTNFHLEPHLIVYEGRNEARMVIEMKRPPMFEYFYVPPFDHLVTTFEDANGGHFSTMENDGFVGMLKSLLVYMIGLDCPRGILTDGYTLILVEIDVTKVGQTSNINNEEDFVNRIPLRLGTFNCKSRYPSYLQVILYFLIKATLDDTNFNSKELFKFEVDLKPKSMVEMEERNAKVEEPKGEQKDIRVDQKSKKRRFSAGDGSINV